jgi:hypothetical protein
MRRFALLLLSLSFMTAVFWGGSRTELKTVALDLDLPANDNAPIAVSHGTSAHAMPPMDVCFAPGTPESYVAEIEDKIWGSRNALDYYASSRWSTTATNPSTGSAGHPITLTYSFIPDGTQIHDQQWGTAPSQLFARMNELFGTPDVWQAKFAQIFAEWARVTGVHYVQVADDGASFLTADGVLGSRGDVRIGCKALDGANGVLAYDYYPDGGDMVLDASENWALPGQDYIFLRNIIAHEHGHGLGLEHVCPTNNTKLLEPYYTPAFDGPQHDDIRGGQRNYGDPYELNNNAATATQIGTVTQDSSVVNASIDHTSDVDFYAFHISAGDGFTLTLQPVGLTYLMGPQQSDGTCSAGTPINSLNALNLDLYLYDGSGNTLLAQSTSHEAGEAERLFRYPVPLSGGDYQAKVTGGGGTDIQMYRLDFNIFDRNDPYLTVKPMDFDTTQSGYPVTLTTKLVNPTNGPRQVSAINMVGPFTVAQQAPLTIPAGDSVALNVTYAAAQLGVQTGSMTITHDGPTGTIVCDLSGATVGVHLAFAGSDSLDFGDVPVGSTDSSRFPIRAVGNTSLIITSISASAPFSIGLQLPDTIGASQSEFIYPRFSPLVVGGWSGTIVFVSNGMESPDTLRVFGNAIPSAAANETVRIPKVFRLAQNYPNPFNPRTTISFDLPCTTEVRVQVFDVQGRLVRELASGVMQAGTHNVYFDGTDLATGIYFCRLTSPQFNALKKMALIK